MTEKPNAASVALIDRDRVLLIQRARAPYRGLWTLPGGRLEPGEDAEAAATREVYEEVGLRCLDLRPVQTLVLEDEPRFVLRVFATEAFEGAIAPSEEIAGYRWARLDELGAFETTDGLAAVIVRALALFGGR